MAGDWIKMRNDLRTDPTVFKLASMTGLDRFAIVGRLAEFWGWADKHAVDGYVDGATPQVIDDVVVYEGFAEKLEVVGWLELMADGIRIPKHERHNGDSAKERTLKSARQARWREKKASETDHDSVDVLPPTPPSTREEKRREEKKPSAPSAAKLPPAPFQVVIDLYHEILPDLPAVRLQTKDRERAIGKTWRWILTSKRTDETRRAETAEQALAWFRSYFERARDNDFLMGRTNRTGEHANWRCDLDFLLTDRGMKHVIEKTLEPA